jgi:transposase
MTNGRVEVITSVERRRRWSAAEKQRLVAATQLPGASVSEVARAAGVHPSQLWGWRRQLRSMAAQTGFAAVQIAAEAGPAEPLGVGAIEIELATGARLRVAGAVEPALLTAAIAALMKGLRR